MSTPSTACTAPIFFWMRMPRVIGKCFFTPTILISGVRSVRTGLSIRSLTSTLIGPLRSCPLKHLLLEDPLLLLERQVAGRRVVPVRGQQLGNIDLAPVEHVWTPRMEGAPGWNEDQRRREPLDRAKPVLGPRLVDSGDGLEQAPRIGHVRVVVDVPGA